MARSAAPSAVPPKQRRGEARVEAILDAAAELFEDRGSEAVTMSDVAARSATAFGSLYRFFPTKEALVDALLKRYAQQTFGRLDELQARAAGLSAAALAAGLVHLVRDLSAARRSTLALLDARPEAAGDRWAKFLETFRLRLGAIVLASAPSNEEACDVAGALCLSLLGGVARTLRESPAHADAIIAGHEAALAGWIGRVRT